MSQAEDDYKDIARMLKEQGEAATKLYIMNLPPARRQALLQEAFKRLVNAGAKGKTVLMSIFSNN